MKRLAVLLLCAAMWGVVVAAPPDPQEAAARQVLVMLRLPPQHFRPDSSYGGGYPDDSGRAARRRVARELAGAYGLKLVDDWPMPAIGIDCYVMEKERDGPMATVLDALARDPRVAWAQAVSLYHGLDGARDPLYPLQPAARAWQLDALQRASTGRGVNVAVVDSGVDGAHPDLVGQLGLRRNFVDGSADAAETHGTAVAGIIAARAGNGLGIAGIAPHARLMALRACWEQAGQAARCSSFTLGKAINFALENDARVINLSLGGPPDRLLQTLLDAAIVRGVAVVGAVDPKQPDGGFPASHPGVIAVAAGGAGGAVLHAPGTDIPASLPGGRWGLVSGSSYAAAHVSGLAALLLELRPRMDVAQLRTTLGSQAGTAPILRTSGAAGAPEQVSAGSIDACAAVARAAGACVCQCPSTVAATSRHTPGNHVH